MRCLFAFGINMAFREILIRTDAGRHRRVTKLMNIVKLCVVITQQ